MIQNLVALGNCLKSGSNRGTGTEWDCALIAVGCTSNGGAGIPTEAYSNDYVLYIACHCHGTFSYNPGISFGHHCSVPRAFL
jgi:hypothetical protein